MPPLPDQQVLGQGGLGYPAPAQPADLRLPRPGLPPPLPQEGPPRIAVVIPAHGQPGLLVEALESVLAQQGAPPLAAIVVDDGCPCPETAQTAFAYAQAHPGRVFALRRRNGGLSAARNTGIAFALAALPDCEAVYFLDADNRLHPGFLARAWAALRAAPASVGWVYPDFDMFGRPSNGSAAGPYAVLAHLSDNLSEAGSLVRRAVLEAGLRFDETLRSGFEDWDFWLGALERGWHGQHLPFAGFQYRKRPESMLAAAERQRELLVQAVWQRHRALTRPRHLLALEAVEAPRFALYPTDGEGVRLLLDPDDEAAEALPVTEARRRFLAARATPSACFHPPYAAFAEPEAMALLCRFGVARMVFWAAQRLLRRHNLVGIRIMAGEVGRLALEPAGLGGRGLGQAPLLLTTSAVLAEAAREGEPRWLDSLMTDAPQPSAALLCVTLPAEPGVREVSSPAPLRRLLLEAAMLGQAMGHPPALPAAWRTDFRQPRGNMAERAHALAGLGCVMPRRPVPGRREIGFVLPVFEFGGVEKVVLNQARVFRARGWGTHLLVLGASRMELFPGTTEAFDSINLAAGFGEEVVDWQEGYSGAGVSHFDQRDEARDVLGLLAGLEVVVNTHAMGGHALMAQLRRLGTRTYAGLHLVERGAWGQPAGNPHVALAYEHAYDGMLVISRQLRDWCIGQGVPPGKLHLVPNAPGYASPRQTVAATLAARENRAAGPLRALFLGRLDAQKGLDRLGAIIAATRHGLPGVEWRVVGRTVFHDETLPELGLTPEPPALGPAALDALYAWADVLVMPSRFEGVPLAVLEAQRLGCVPIVTNVGAVAEIVTDAGDGLLVDASQPEDAIIAAFASRLEQLAAGRGALRAMARRGAARVAARGWHDTLAPFIAHLEALLPTDALR